MIYNIYLLKIVYSHLFAKITSHKGCGVLEVSSAGRSQGGAEARAKLEAGANVVQISTELI